MAGVEPAFSLATLTQIAVEGRPLPSRRASSCPADDQPSPAIAHQPLLIRPRLAHPATPKALPVDLIGMNSKLMAQYIEFVAGGARAAEGRGPVSGRRPASLTGLRASGFDGGLGWGFGVCEGGVPAPSTAARTKPAEQTSCREGAS